MMLVSDVFHVNIDIMKLINYITNILLFYLCLAN